MSCYGNDEFLKTDAQAGAPRDEIPNDTPRQSFHNGGTKLEEEDNSFEGPSKSNIRNEPEENYNIKPNKVENMSQVFVINISDSNKVHVGNKLIYNVNSSKSYSKQKEIRETEAIRLIMNSCDDVNKAHIQIISQHVGEQWRDVGRALNYSEGQIQQFYIDHHQYGLKEVIYQLLLDWIQNEPDSAKLGLLAKTLWDTNHREAVEILSKTKM